MTKNVSYWQTVRPDTGQYQTPDCPASGVWLFLGTGHVRRPVSGHNMKAGHVRHPVSGRKMKAGHVRSPVSGRDVKTGQVWRPVSGENFVSGRPLILYGKNDIFDLANFFCEIYKEG